MPNDEIFQRQYLPSDQQVKKVENAFTYHAPIEDQAHRYSRIREAYRDLALLILQLTPPSREQSVALTELETSAMWTNKAIACNEEPTDTTERDLPS